MPLEVDVQLNQDRGVYEYYVTHDGAKVIVSERKTGNVDKRRAAAAAAAAEAADEAASK
jgi:hypothetical protein